MYPQVRPRSRSPPRLHSRPHPLSNQYFSSEVYPLARSCSRSPSPSCSRYSAISLVIESECERASTLARMRTHMWIHCFRGAAWKQTSRSLDHILASSTSKHKEGYQKESTGWICNKNSNRNNRQDNYTHK